MQLQPDFLGSFTTFSALSMETIKLAENGQYDDGDFLCRDKHNRWIRCWCHRVSTWAKAGGSMTILELTIVGAGGFFGAVLRYFISTTLIVRTKFHSAH